MDGGGKVIDVIQDVEQLVERSEEEEIIERLKESAGGRGELYYDGHFGGTPAALYRDEQFVPDYDADLTAQVSWLRPHEFTASPEYFVDGTSSGDVVQGRLGDCWIMGSLAAVANHPDQLIENLFGSDPDDFKKYGVYTCRFYKDGAWVEVVTDTRIPCAPGGSGSGAEMIGLRSASTPSPMYGRTRDLGEQWVMLLEKAYAKAHGSYEALHGGSVAEALVDFTGGSSEKIVLTEPHVQQSVKNGKLWKKLRRYASWRYLMGCSHSEADAGAEDEMPNGLFKNHCYTVRAAAAFARAHRIIARVARARAECGSSLTPRRATPSFPPARRCSASSSSATCSSCACATRGAWASGAARGATRRRTGTTTPRC